MQSYEYRVIPAPRRGEKARGARTAAERFAHALTHLMNEMGRDGWEYLRADILPCEERVGLTGTTTQFQHLLVFRRAADSHQGSNAPAPGMPAATPLSAAPAEPAPAILPPLPPRAPEGAPPALGPALPPLPTTRPNGRL